jgi:Flp pilus assembly protein TadG
MRLHTKSRSAATMVEFAIIGSLIFLLILGLIIGGTGVFRYQQVATLAREGSRWASVRGTQYHQDTGQPAATQATIQSYIQGKAVGLDVSKLTVTVPAISNTVSVTVSYQWIPEAFFGGGSMTLTSTSVSVMAN